MHTMKTMKFVLFFAIGIFGFSQSYGQEQIRLRFGATKSFKSGADKGLHSSGGYGSPLPSGIGLEYYRPLPKKRASFLAGVFFEYQGYSGGTNPTKFPASPISRGYASYYQSIKIYGGVEKILTKNTRPKANTLSVIAGVALGINAMGVGKIGSSSFEQAGKTLNGDIYGGVHLNEPEGSFRDGYYFIMDAKTANTFTPDVFAGLRWNIKNRQAKTVFVVEGIVNYSLLPKVYIDFPYTLNGKPMTDRIKNHGFNAQINVLIPLKTFGKQNK